MHFIGAGPGAPDLITVRGLRLIERCPVCLYAGSLVPAEVVAAAPKGARVLDTAPMTSTRSLREMQAAVADGKEVARVHSGDPSLYGAIAEQIRRLKALGIPYDVTPGVPAFAAAAAALGRELTIPEVSQTVILTRTAMKSSAMPEGEDLATLARSGATLVIHLSIRNLLEIERQLVAALRRRLPGRSSPTASAGRTRLSSTARCADIRDKVRAAKITRTALVFVGRALADSDFRDSALYDASHVHVLRPKRRVSHSRSVEHAAEWMPRSSPGMTTLEKRSLAFNDASITWAKEPMTRPRRRPIAPSFSPCGIFGLEQPLALAFLDDAGEVEFVRGERRRPGQVAERRQPPIAEMQPAFLEARETGSSPSMRCGLPSASTESVAQHHVAAALAVDQRAARGRRLHAGAELRRRRDLVRHAVPG